MICSRPALALVAVLVCLMTAPGSAQAESTVPGMAVDFDGWRYIPIFEDRAVQSFVMLAIEPSPLGTSNTVSTMWFVRDGRSWSGFSWRDASQRDALTEIKQTLGLADETDTVWPVRPGLRPTGSTTATREALIAGLFENDPLVPLIKGQQDPIGVLSVLVSAGWSASDATLFASECRRDQLLNGLADGFVLELAGSGRGDETIGAAIDSKVCQGGGGPVITCTPRTVIGGPFVSGCIFLGWTHNGTTTKPATGGGCWIENSWTGTHFYYERRRVRKIYANCTSCVFIQQRVNNCTARIAGVDFAVGVQNPCAIPAGYTPPAGPAAGTSCGAANEDCAGWTGWSPDAANSPCP